MLWPPNWDYKIHQVFKLHPDLASRMMEDMRIIIVMATVAMITTTMHPPKVVEVVGALPDQMSNH